MTERFGLLKSNPTEYLRLADELISQNPQDPIAYFSRHHVWIELGKPELALADLDRSLELERHGVTYAARGQVFHLLGRFRQAIDDFNASQAMDEGTGWAASAFYFAPIAMLASARSTKHSPIVRCCATTIGRRGHPPYQREPRATSSHESNTSPPWCNKKTQAESSQKPSRYSAASKTSWRGVATET